ncbi:MAG: hypothetical protein NC543_13680 [bacterium]|nr:hypothetical protein [bacterium]
MACTRLIKFDYCQLYYRVKDSDYKLFNIELLMQKISDQQLVRKAIEIYEGCKIRIEEFDFNDNNALWTMRILRLREDNLSFVVKPDEEAKPIELGEDEYLGEDMTMLFDITNNIAMIQRNRYALGFTNLQKTIQKITCIDGLKIDIRPITKIVDARTIQRDYFKSIEIRFANLKNSHINSIGGSLGMIMNTYKELDGAGGSFIVNLGRTRRNSLAKEPTRQLLCDILDNQELFNAAILRAKDAEDNDIDIINLFDNIYSVFISYNIAERKSLNYEYCVNKMIEKYLEDAQSILTLIQNFVH